jgi:hypothetical protein
MDYSESTDSARLDKLRAHLEVGQKELDAGLRIPAEEVFRWLEQRAAELDRQAHEGASMD